ncbi:DNA binding protein [Carex littledalei]|uniref:DNA binding protein n=1 Tax=Carex littledalei TaxID=544730 RepID=A0A833VB79_9POAL|nr:DNA binding protein [Carex littledalei]
MSDLGFGYCLISDEAESGYFCELEEALIHGDPITGSHGPRKGFIDTTRPPTLEIFPSWPMRHHHHQLSTEQRKSEQSAGSSEESGSVKDTTNTASTGAISGEQSQVQCRGRGAAEGEAQKGLVNIMANGASQRTGVHQPPPPPPPIQFDNSHTEKRKITGSTRKEGRLIDAKTLRRLAQNREAARKSRLRKKAYVQQLESSRIRLQQLEQELQRVRTQIVTPHLDPTDQQLIRLCSLQQSSQQAEEALSQGLEQLHQFLSATLSSGPLSTDGVGADVNSYASLMAIAIEKISSLENFVRQADNLRQQTLHQLREILTTRQAARCLLAIGEYYRRLRALSSAWSTRSREALIGNESASTNTVMDLQAISQSQYNNYSAFYREQEREREMLPLAPVNFSK